MKLTKQTVRELAARYQSELENHGEHNMGTQRAYIIWQGAEATYRTAELANKAKRLWEARMAKNGATDAEAARLLSEHEAALRELVKVVSWGAK